MPHLIHHPVRPVTDKRSAQGLVDCALQELEMLRFDIQTKDTDVFVDQGKHYFLDAAKSDWRSAGLLYYYSFLNLAKAYLIGEQRLGLATLTTTKAYHGLSAEAQDNLSSILDFKLQISPPQGSKGQVNVFSTMYEALTGQAWPLPNPIKISVSDIATHFIDVGDEMQRLYAVSSQLCYVQSLVRNDGSGAWFEILTLHDSAQRVKSSMPHWPSKLKQYSAMDQLDKNEWFVAYNRSPVSMRSCSLVSGPFESGTNADELQQAMSKVAFATNKAFSGQAIPTCQIADEHWLFIPQIQLGGKELRWHPMLSDYLFAFVLSTILRYQPYILKQGTKDYFLCEAWCRQAPVTTLRYFLMISTSLGIRVHTAG